MVWMAGEFLDTRMVTERTHPWAEPELLYDYYISCGIRLNSPQQPTLGTSPRILHHDSHEELDTRRLISRQTGMPTVIET